MAFGRNHGAAGIVALALAFHRAPVQHADLLRARAPLPPGVGTLLKLAGGSAPDPEYAALARPDELREAALFFIEQVLFHHDGNHYRVLGLEPGASTGQIKEHHRLLMRIFHPDRERHADDWKDAFATRINLAYTSLHDPDARRRYAATLKPAARPGTTLRPARRTAVLHPAAALPGVLPPWLLHYLPQWVLAGTALFALVIVGNVYVNNPRPPSGHLAEPLLLAETGSQKLAASFPAGKQPIAAIESPPPPTELTGLSQRSGNLSPPTPAVAQVQAPLRAAPPLQPAPTPARNHHSATPAHAKTQRPPVAPAARQLAGNPTTATATRVETATPPAPLQKVPVPQVAPPEPRATAVATRPIQLDPNATLARFVSIYERGDTLAFMSLFDEVAIGKAGGKSQIRQEYESLFQSTDLRHIAIDNMAWTQEGDWMRGEGRYRTTLMRKGELKLQTETGTIRIELLRRGDHALIMGLDYQPGERS
jgi:hypothetical protein